jgi:hypothetical protein
MDIRKSFRFHASWVIFYDTTHPIATSIRNNHPTAQKIESPSDSLVQPVIYYAQRGVGAYAQYTSRTLYVSNGVRILDVIGLESGIKNKTCQMAWS